MTNGALVTLLLMLLVFGALEWKPAFWGALCGLVVMGWNLIAYLAKDE